jgi:hypothetical protein
VDADADYIRSEDAFGSAGGNGKSPLRKVDADADNLTVVAMLIVRSLQ